MTFFSLSLITLFGVLMPNLSEGTVHPMLLALAAVVLHRLLDDNNVKRGIRHDAVCLVHVGALFSILEINQLLWQVIALTLVAVVSPLSRILLSRSLSDERPENSSHREIDSGFFMGTTLLLGALLLRLAGGQFEFDGAGLISKVVVGLSPVERLGSLLLIGGLLYLLAIPPWGWSSSKLRDIDLIPLVLGPLVGITALQRWLTETGLIHDRNTLALLWLASLWAICFALFKASYTRRITSSLESIRLLHIAGWLLCFPVIGWRQFHEDHPLNQLGLPFSGEFYLEMMLVSYTISMTILLLFISTVTRREADVPETYRLFSGLWRSSPGLSLGMLLCLLNLGWFPFTFSWWPRFCFMLTTIGAQRQDSLTRFWLNDPLMIATLLLWGVSIVGLNVIVLSHLKLIMLGPAVSTRRRITSDWRHRLLIAIAMSWAAVGIAPGIVSGLWKAS